MADKIDMSLDDIIKMDKTNKKGPRGGGGGQRGGLGNRRGGGASGGKSNFGRFSGNLNNVRTGGITKATNRQTLFSRQGKSTGALSGKWQHDMFEGGLRTGGGGTGHLLVSNLDYRVSDADIQELFVEFGMLRKAAVHYDKSGRSLGTADVIYEERKNAVTAMQKYNGVPLDGRAMKIILVNKNSNNTSPNVGLNRGSTGSSFNRLGQKRGFGGRGGFVGGGNRRGQGRAAAAAAPTAEELDAELDAYVNKM